MLGAVAAAAARTVTAVGSDPEAPVMVLVPGAPPATVEDNTTTVFALELLVVVPVAGRPLAVGRTVTVGATLVLLFAELALDVTSITVVVLEFDDVDTLFALCRRGDGTAGLSDSSVLKAMALLRSMN